MITLASVHLGPIQFDTPVWLILIPVCWALTLLIARKSLAGGGTVTRWVRVVGLPRASTARQVTVVTPAR